jgi:hypothetical protein
MIIIPLSGGLGNQLFQYAFGQSLKFLRTTDVRYKPHFDSLIDRKLELTQFELRLEVATEEEFQSILKQNNALFRRATNRILPYYKRLVVSEAQYHFDPNLFKVPSTCIVDGYFQSEKYFAVISNTLRKQLVLEVPHDEANQGWWKRIRESESVSVHIRRGDYLGNALFPIYGKEYVDKAVDVIRKKVNNPVFFIFSNDLPWAKQTLRLNFPTYFVDHNSSDQPHNDMFLMSQCKHNIVANSSFSWWAAWLNQEHSKVIIAPPRWVNQNSTFYSNIDDITPSNWIRLQGSGF